MKMMRTAKNPFVLSLSKDRPYFQHRKRKGQPFDKLRASG